MSPLRKWVTDLRQGITLSDMTTQQASEPYSTSFWVASGLRGEIARAGLTQAAVAARIGVTEAWVSRRLSQSAKVHLTLEDIDLIASALGLDGIDVILASVESRGRLRRSRDVDTLLEEILLRARRDSNPKPSDLYLVRGGLWSGKEGRSQGAASRPCIGFEAAPLAIVKPSLTQKWRAVS